MFWLLLLFYLFNPRPVSAADWSYPISDYFARQTQKGFAQYIDKAWYKDKTTKFPNQFTGFHTGIDLEIFPGELDTPVPVYAITSGRVTFIGSVSGYGGVILFRPQSEPVTYLYGHIKTTGVSVDRTFSSGETLTYLGDAFSSQTGGERKHLHFGIYRGSENYFRGYESTLSALNSKFLDPNQYLQERITISPSPTPQAETSKNPGFWISIFNWLKSLF